jgi:hypothetical protein
VSAGPTSRCDFQLFASFENAVMDVASSLQVYCDFQGFAVPLFSMSVPGFSPSPLTSSIGERFFIVFG